MGFYQWILLLRLLIPLIYLNRFDRYNTVKIILINRPDNPAINVYLASFYRQRLSFRESLSRKISAPPVWLDCSPIYRIEISYDRNYCIVLSAMKINSFIRLKNMSNHWKKLFKSVMHLMPNVLLNGNNYYI